MEIAEKPKSRRGSRRAKARSARKARRSRGGGRKRTSRRDKVANKKERAKAFALWGRVLAVSGVVNGLLLALLMLIVLVGPPRQPPVIYATQAAPENEDEVANETLERVRRQHQSASSSTAALTPVVAPAVSPVAFAPTFEVTDSGELPGAAIGLGDAFGYGGSGSGMGGGESGSIGGMRVKARRLGVILDTSGSMNEEIKAVRKEIRRAFSQASVVEVTGCRLDWDGENPHFDAKKSKLKYATTAKTVTEAAEMLIVDRRVDAIFWFSDLNDPHTKDGTDRLSHLLGTNFGSERRPVKFYVQSVDREPTEILAGIATRSGGASKVQSYGE